MLGAFGLSGIPVACSPAPARTRVRLPVPMLLAPTGGRMSLRAQQGATSFVAGIASSTRGFNGSFLGPTLLLRSGATTDVAVTNGLDESTTVHWHGILIPSEADGGPHHLIQPNGTWRTALEVDQPPATLWYHAHPHPRTATQVYSGLAGMIIVSDGRDADVGLPHRYGVDDIPLILRDAVLDQGRLVYPQHPMAPMHGVRGPTMLANGAVDPITPVPRAWVRLRLVNASNARVFDLAFKDEREFLWIGTDGGLLSTPTARRSLVLAPGQRAELLVDFTAGEGVALMTSRDPTVARGWAWAWA